MGALPQPGEQPSAPGPAAAEEATAHEEGGPADVAGLPSTEESHLPLPLPAALPTQARPHLAPHRQRVRRQRRSPAVQLRCDGLQAMGASRPCQSAHHPLPRSTAPTLPPHYCRFGTRRLHLQVRGSWAGWRCGCCLRWRGCWCWRARPAAPAEERRGGEGEKDKAGSGGKLGVGGVGGGPAPLIVRRGWGNSGLAQLWPAPAGWGGVGSASREGHYLALHARV